MSPRQLIAFFIAALLPCAALAQVPAAPVSTSPAILKAIDADVWIPYSKAFAEHKVNDYIALHSKSLVRLMADLKYVDPYDSFAKNMQGMFTSLGAQKLRVGIQFRFTERFANKDTATERGIYEFTMTDVKGGSTKSYSRFHNVMKKEGGKWKILMDYDSTEKNKLTEADYKAAFARDDYAKY